LSRWTTVIIASILGAALAAAAPVATISSAEPFQLRGASVPVRGVPDWPLSAGDEIATGAAPAMISFADGSRVYLNSHTRAKLQVTGKQNVLRLMQGDLAYKVSKNSLVSVAGLNREPLPGDSSEGLLSIDNQAAVWAPKGFNPAAAGGPPAFVQYRITPFNRFFVSQWRDYRPPFGVAPFGPPPGGNDEPPPPPEVDPEPLRPISGSRP
jgi:hypothetical protein